MSMEKYGTYIVFQNIETDEVIEIPFGDEETLNKYANDSNWREIDRSKEPSKGETEDSEFIK